MADNQNLEIGSIGWIDLTVADAPRIRQFYEAVTGWKAHGVSMKDGEAAYEDWAMLAESGKSVAGVCHARGMNTTIPAQWLIYIVVENLDVSLAKVTELGGKQVTATRTMGPSRFAVIQDPAGAVCALFEVGEDAPGS